MNKKLAWGTALVALGAASCAGLTWYLGERAAQRYQEGVAQLRQWLGEDAVAEQRYERGFWVSHARLIVQWTPPADDGTAGDASTPHAPLRLRIESDVHHGPFAQGRLAAAVVQTRLGLDGLDERTRELLSHTGAPTVATVLQWNGASQSRLDWPAGALGEKGSLLQWQALRYDLAVSADRTQSRGDIQWPGLTLQLADTPTPDEGGNAPEVAPTHIDLAVQGLQGSFEMRVQDGLWLVAPGTSTFRVAQLSLDSEQQGAARTRLAALRDLNGKVVIERKDAFMGWTVDVQTQGSVGPMALDALSWQERVERIDAQALKQVQQALLAALRTPAAKQGGASPADDEAAWLKPLAQAVPPLLAGLPAYTSNVKATMGGKEGSLAYGLRLTSAPSEALMAGKDWNAVLMQHGALHGKLRVPKAWVAQVMGDIGEKPVSPEELDSLLGMAYARGFVTLETEHVASEVRLQDGQLQLNGKAIPLPFMNDADDLGDQDGPDDGLDNED